MRSRRQQDNPVTRWQHCAGSRILDAMFVSMFVLTAWFAAWRYCFSLISYEIAFKSREMAEYVNEVRLGTIKILEELKISPGYFLDGLSGRSVCPNCGKSRKYFCYTCYVPMDEIAEKIPRLSLPLKVDIIKHPREVDGKSTAVHAAVLAPNDVSIYTYPCIPTYEKEKVLMIFPGAKSVTFSQLRQSLRLKQWGSIADEAVVTRCSHERATNVLQHDDLRRLGLVEKDNDPRSCPSEDQFPDSEKLIQGAGLESTCCRPLMTISRRGQSAELKIADVHKDILKSSLPFERIILIDSTWNQVRSIRKDERLQGILRVELTERESCFWRFQRGKPRTYLSTIESIYYFFVDAHRHFVDEQHYDGHYDDLLFFFKYMFLKIHSLYDPSKLRVYQQKSSES